MEINLKVKLLLSGKMVHNTRVLCAMVLCLRMLYSCVIFIVGMIEGRGTFTWASGNKYVGNFKVDVILFESF